MREIVNVLKWAYLIRNVQTSSNSPLLCKFSLIGLLGQKFEDIFKFTIFDQKSVRMSLKLRWARKERATLNLPILVFVVNNIKGTSIGCF